eukprot:scaffold63863_cov44-Attheya_sp.AAC.3
MKLQHFIIAFAMTALLSAGNGNFASASIKGGKGDQCVQYKHGKSSKYPKLEFPSSCCLEEEQRCFVYDAFESLKDTTEDTIGDLFSSCLCPCCDEDTCNAFFGTNELSASSDTFCDLMGCDSTTSCQGFPITNDPDASGLQRKIRNCAYRHEDGAIVPVPEPSPTTSPTSSRRLVKETPSPAANPVPADISIKDFAGCCYHLFDIVTSETGCESTDDQRRSRRLNDLSRKNKRRVSETANSLSVDVDVKEPESMTWLAAHVDEMQERMLSGNVPRAWDPLFKAYFDNLDAIEIDCRISKDSLKCTSTGVSQCAKDLNAALLSYHDKVAESISEKGTHKVTQEHEIPESCKM